MLFRSKYTKTKELSNNSLYNNESLNIYAYLKFCNTSCGVFCSVMIKSELLCSFNNSGAKGLRQDCPKTGANTSVKKNIFLQFFITATFINDKSRHQENRFPAERPETLPHPSGPKNSLSEFATKIRSKTT